MGCDIHPYFEIKNEEGKWERLATRLSAVITGDCVSFSGLTTKEKPCFLLMYHGASEGTAL